MTNFSPTNSMGLTAAETRLTVKNGGKKTKAEVGYDGLNPDAAFDCSACKFFTPGGDAQSGLATHGLGTCEVVKGAVHKRATSKLFISAELEQEAIQMTKELEIEQEAETKDATRVEKHNPTFVGAATSFAELHEQEKANELRAASIQLAGMVENVVVDASFNSDLTPQQKADLIADGTIRLGQEFVQESKTIANKERWQPLTDIVKRGVEAVKNAVGGEQVLTKGDSFQFVKQADGSFRWLAIYSNKFRDEDGVPEIISEASHKEFDRKLSSGEVEFPELWALHVDGTRWGKADFHAYDDDGFVIAAGTVDPGMEHIAENFIKGDDDITWGVSHGMPIKSIKRATDDPTIIIEHETVEISLLPLDMAANKLTGFDILQNEVKEMLSDDKKNILTSLGFDVDALSASVKGKASEAAQDGIEYKATDEVETPVVEQANAPDEAPEQDDDAIPASIDTDESAEADAVSRAEMSEFAEQIGGALVEVVSEIKAIREQLNDSKQAEAEAIKELAETTPAASLAQIFAGVIGNEATRVDGRSKQAKDGPVETKTQSKSGFAIPFLNNLTSVE